MSPPLGVTYPLPVRTVSLMASSTACLIDGSARGLQAAHNSFYQSKSRETCAWIGPWIVTADEIADPQRLQIRLWVNGVLKQNFNTSDMGHKIPRCIEFVSSIHTLEPGD